MHLKPHLAALPLAEVRKAHVADLYKRLGEAGVSDVMQAKIGRTLRAALQAAVADGFLAANPCAACRPPRREQTPDVNAWTAEEARRFLDAVKADRLYPLYALALDSGMRQGEMFGLHWTELDLDAGAVRVTRSLSWRKSQPRLKEPKTKASRRRVLLARETVAALRRHRDAMQATGRDVEAGPVFCDRKGGFLRPNNVVRRSFEPALARAKVRPYRFHDLRHTSATLLLLDGVHVKAVSARLGHSSAKMTLDVHAAFLPEMDEKAAASTQRTLFGPIVSRMCHSGFIGGEEI